MSKLLIGFLLILSKSLSVLANNRTFPDGFYFGVATAAYQIEGAWSEDGKGENIWDHMVHTNSSFIQDNNTADIACDSYHKFKEDVALAADLGLAHYRFSIAWTRIFSNGYGNEVNMKGILYYQSLIEELLSHNIIPVVTLYHWDLPQPLQDIGGWTNPIMVDYFVRYARTVFQYFTNVEYWATFNEPKQICRAGYGLGTLAPAINLDGIGDYMCAYVILKAHAAVYHLYHDEFSSLNGKITMVIDSSWFEPFSVETVDQEAAERKLQFEFGLYANPIFNGNWPQTVIDRVKERSANENITKSRLPEFTQEEIDYINGTYDFLGFNHYKTNLASDEVESEYGDPSYDKDVRVGLSTDPSWNVSANGNPIVPWGIRKFLTWIKNTYNNPTVFITENGVSDDGSSLDDSDRIRYLEEYLSAILDAIYEDGVNVIGYTCWSLMDNFEWIKGYSSHFGLYYINFTDSNLTRVAKKSVDFYRQLATTLVIPAGPDEETTTSYSITSEPSESSGVQSPATSPVTSPSGPSQSTPTTSQPETSKVTGSSPNSTLPTPRPTGSAWRTSSTSLFIVFVVIIYNIL